MARPNLFLRTKLLPPRAVPELLSRPRLIEKLKANLNSPVTLVAADAGWGKTTLISDFIRSQSRQAVWYQLDHTDADPFVFLGYVTHGIKKFAPNLGETVLPYLTEATDELLRFPERAVDLLLNEMLETVDQPFILVLDDYHHIGADTVVHKIVDRLIQYSSDIMHLIITTRDLPPLAITRRRSQAAALVITRDDLLFTDDEMRKLFRTTLGVELRDDEIVAYRERTRGWITALQLVRQIAAQELHKRPGKSVVDLGKILHQSEKDIFDYFAEEVFTRESDEIQHLMLYVSLLESLPLDVCSGLFPAMHCSAVLPKLLHKNVFLTVAGEESDAEVYRLHPLFRDFLQRRLRSEIGRAGLEKERMRIGEYFLTQNQWEKALPYFLESENFDKAARIIAEQGGDWIESGAITTLENFIEKIPSGELERHPRSLLHKAEIARLRGETVKSSTILNQAVKLLSKTNDTDGEAEALHSLASNARRRGDYPSAFEFLEKAEKLVKKDSETYLKCANTRGLCLVNQGLWTQAEQQFRMALELAEKQSNEHFIRLITHNLALPSGFRGDFAEALRWFKRIFRDDKGGKPMPQEAIGYLNVARLHIFRGEFDDAERHLELALEICQLYDLKSLRGEIFESYANSYRGKHDFTHAAEFYERALRAYDDAGVDLATRDLDEERAKFLLLTGEKAKARGILEHLLAARVEMNNEFGVRTIKLVLCRARLLLGETEKIEEDLTELVGFFQEQNLNYDEANASLLLAVACHRIDERRKIFAPLQRAMDLTARFDYEYWLRSEMGYWPEFFADEEVAERLPQDLSESPAGIRAEIQPPVPAVVIERAAQITDLTVKTLGFVDIYRDSTKPFAPDAWTTKRSRDIFCYTATSPYRRADKDVLMYTFWRDEDLETVEKNFHPTISHIRKALNNRQTLKLKFLIFRDGAYQLNPELVYSIDTEDFEHAIAAAEKAKREKDNERFREHLETAHSLYRGEYMAGVYDVWVEERRHYYAEQHARALNGLAKILFSQKSWSAVIKYAGEILQIDPYREDAHRLLMKVYAAQGKRAKIKEQYESLEKLLKDELGVKPATETSRVFEELLK